MRESASTTDIGAVVFIVIWVVTFFVLLWVLDGIEVRLDGIEAAIAKEAKP